MARQRDIKPGFFKNEDLGEVEPLARLLFAGLWCWADKKGRLEDRPKKLKADILPYDTADGNTLLQQLADRNFIIRYEANGSKYIQIVNWEKHQKPHPKEAASDIPSPSEESNVISTESNGNSGKGNGKDGPFQPIPSFPSIPSCKDDDNNAREELGLIKTVDKIYRSLSPMETEFLLDWGDTFPDDVILDCVRRSFEAGNLSIAYMRSIFVKWQQQAVKTMDDVRRLDDLWEQKKNKHATPRGKPENALEYLARRQKTGGG